MSIEKIIYIFLFLPVILFLGILSCFGDIKHSKVYNSLVVAGCLYGLSVHVFFLFVGYLNGIFKVPISYAAVAYFLNPGFLKWFVNFFICTFVGYFLWRSKIWGAGDAKLFITYSVLIPVGQYQRSFFSGYFSSFYLLCMTFFPSTIYLLLRLFVKNFASIGKIEIKTFFTMRFRLFIEYMYIQIHQKKYLRWLKQLATFFITFAFFRLFKILIAGIGGTSINFNEWPALSILFLLKRSYGFIKKERKIISLLILIFLGIILFKKIQTPFELMSTLSQSFVFAFFYSLFFSPLYKGFNYLVENCSRAYFSEHIPLAPWMFLGVLITWFF